MTATSQADNRHYFTIWRWHFYTGFLIAPFLMILAVTGLGMVLTANITGKELDRTPVTVQAQAEPVALQAQQAMKSLPHGEVVQYIAPRSADTVAIFRVKSLDNANPADNTVLIDPYTNQVVKSIPRNSNLYHTFDSFHGDMMLGKVGDYIMETTAALTILMILTGGYLWWHKRRSVKAMLIPNNTAFTQNPNQKRTLFRTLHATLGSWVAIVLLFFCITGMAWAGIWGGKMVQAWSQFPAGKWDVEPTPVSVNPLQHHDAMMTMPKQPHIHGVDTAVAPTHGDVLNDGQSKEVPWVLELTPMPQSRTNLGHPGIGHGTAITIDGVDKLARKLGFVGRYQLNLPKGDTGVWTISQDSMSYDMQSPVADRTVHIDRYSGKVLGDIRYDDYNFFGKFMAVGIALHMGTLGLWSIVANVLFCLSVIVICISGYVMWWQRRPLTANTQVSPLNPPATHAQRQIPWGFAILLLAVAVIFPTAMMAIVVIGLLDWWVISRVPSLAKLLK